MINFTELDFTNKTVLEVGTGRGGTTIQLAKVMKNYTGAKLISTDIFDGNFEQIGNEISRFNIEAKFIKTDGCELEGIENNSIDYLICNYTLCAINTNSGSVTIALNRFKEVLKTEGILYIEEEYPLNFVENPKQQIWSRKWQLLRSVNMLLGNLSYNELRPSIMEKILLILGFENIQWETSSHLVEGEDCLDFFKYRFNRVLNNIKNQNIVNGLKQEMLYLEEEAKKAGGMETPIYKITAKKSM